MCVCVCVLVNTRTSQQIIVLKKILNNIQQTITYKILFLISKIQLGLSHRHWPQTTKYKTTHISFVTHFYAYNFTAFL